MNHTLIKSTAVAALVALTTTVQAEPNTSEGYSNSSSQSQSQADHDDSPASRSRSMGNRSGSKQYEESDHSMQDMQLTGDADRDFAIRMKLHHQQGVEMARAHLKDGKSPQMKSMAKKLIAAQNKEIAQFDKWIDSQR